MPENLLAMTTGRYAGESPNPPQTFEHQVFLSFRGTDTRIFVGHLFSSLKKAGVRVFLDNDGLEHGRDIQLKLYNAIHHSEMSVVIVSLGYADSRWCLDELAEIMELHKSKNHSVLPVFFDVEPTVVRNQTGAYMDAFKELEKRFGGEMDRVKKWRWALKQVASLRGLSLNADRNEALLVESIIQEVGKLVRATPLYVPPNIVGRNDILKRINMWVQDGSSDVEVGLIYGLAGIGKTTIAQLVFNHNAEKFDGASFLADFTRKTAQSDGLTYFLEQIILDVTGKSGNKIYNVERGLMAVRASVHLKKVLVVLDDVDELKQLPAAFDDHNFFGKGSKIIITTKNQELRKVSILKQMFEVVGLGDKDSMKLLKLHSLVKRNPSSQSQEELFKGFLRHCHGLPLAHIVMGRMLRAETQEMWEDRLNEMDRYPNKDVQNVFRMSYDAIGNNDDKELFLFIACFFIGMHKKQATFILDSCGFRAVSGLQKLIYRCLVNVDYDDSLTMHQSIEKMGKEIVDLEAIDKRSKLWNSKDSLSLLLNDKGTLSVRGLRLNLSDINRHTSPLRSKPSAKRSRLSSIETSAFKNMPNLDILLLSNVQLVEKSFEDFPLSIKWIQWEGFPLESISLNLNLDEVVVLNMQKSCLVHAWEGSKELWALRVLYLHHSDHLVTTPDLSCAPLLELISFEGCISLVEVHESVGNLERLEQLNLKGCISLVKIHGSFKKVDKLTTLNLNGCKRLTNLPMTMLSSVEKLDITECQSLLNALNQMESSGISMSSLTTISPNDQSLLNALNQMESSGISMSSLSTISSYERSMTQYLVPYWQFKVFLPALKILNISNLGISQVHIFDLIKCAPSLEELDLSNNPIRVLSSVDKDACSRLERLCAFNCTDLQSISNIPAFCEVYVDGCISLERITYTYTSSRAMAQLPVTYTHGCGKLVEVHCGSSDLLAIERQGEMDEYQAKYLGFPAMNIFKQISWGVYRGGTYSVWLAGNLLLSEWFTTKIDGSELLYQVPSYIPGQLSIRALNLGVLDTIDTGSSNYEKDLGNNWLSGVKIENLSNKWEWSFPIQELRGFWEMGYGITTWLSHCCVMEHREIRPGDLLKISARGHFLTRNRTLRMGIKVVYEEQTEGEKQEPCSSRRQIKVGWVDNEEEVASVAAVKCVLSVEQPPSNRKNVTRASFFPGVRPNDFLSYYKYYDSTSFQQTLPIVALDFGFVRTSEGFSRLNIEPLPSRVWEVRIDNQKSKEKGLQNWTFKVPYRVTGNMNGEVMTMVTLYHMCRMEDKDVDAHDVLKISVCEPTDPQLKLGIKVVYKESEKREETQESSSKSQSKIREDDIEEEVAYPVHVVSWYNKTLRPPHLDLSFFEVEKDANEDIADVDEKVKKYYRIGDTKDRNGDAYL